MTGSLALVTPDSAQGVVVFDQGAPKKVSVAAPRCKLGEMLIELGWLDASTAKHTYQEAFQRHEPHGKVLLEHRLVDENGLFHVLFYQFIRKLDWIATRPAETVLELQEGRDLLEALPSLPIEVSPLAVLWGMAKHHVDETHKRALFQRVGDVPLKLHEQSAPQQFGFGELDLVLIERLRRAPSNLASLLYQVALPRTRAEAVLYTLLLTRHVDIGDGQRPIGLNFAASSPRVTSEPPSRRSRIAPNNVGPSRAERSMAPGPLRRINRSLAKHTRRRAEQLLASDRLLQAETEAQRARELDPDNPDSAALCLWIQALLTTNPEELERLLATMGSTLERVPCNVQLRFYRAELLKRLDHFEQAIEEWRHILELEPNHLDALRELRLWEMRCVSSGPPRKLMSGVRPLANHLGQSAPGLFGRLFKGPR